MPDTQADIRRELTAVRETARQCETALLEPIASESAASLRYMVETAGDRLMKVREWLDEQLR